MTLSTHYDLRMTPLDTLLREIYDIDPTFTIVYDSKQNKTLGVCGFGKVFNAESLSQAIILTWLHYFSQECINER